MATQAITRPRTAGPVRGTSVRRQRILVDLITYLLLALGAAIVLVPFWWMVKTSLTAETRLFQFPPQFFPEPVVWRNYIDAWYALPVSFTRFTANTVFITALAMTAEILTCSLVAYGFARFRFPGRNFLFILMLSTMMLPGVVTLVPTFILWRELKLIDTYDPMTLGAWFAWGPSYVFLLRQFFLGLPREIEEAARIDGATFAPTAGQVTRELGFYFVSDGTPRPWRMKVRSPSFVHLQVLPTMIRGQLVADVVTAIGSIDIVLGEVDR